MRRSLSQQAKRAGQELLDRAGLQFRPREMSVLDFRGECTDPRSQRYYRNPLLLEVPTQRVRSLYFDLVATGEHPFVRAATALLDSSLSLDDGCAALSQYYSLVQPFSMADLLGLSPPSNPLLADTPVWGVRNPWEAGQPVRLNRLALSTGPASDAEIRREVRRLSDILRSITDHGYRRHDGKDGDINGVVMQDEYGNWVFRVHRGLHRSAALAALGYSRLPIRISAEIFRGDASVWPQVRGGMFSIEEAQVLFDTYFGNLAPPSLTEWLK